MMNTYLLTPMLLILVLFNRGVEAKVAMSQPTELNKDCWSEVAQSPDSRKHSEAILQSLKSYLDSKRAGSPQLDRPNGLAYVIVDGSRAKIAFEPLGRQIQDLENLVSAWRSSTSSFKRYQFSVISASSCDRGKQE